MEKENKKINNTVDIIKFIAAILVIFSHSFSLSSSSKDYLTMWINQASIGSLSVSIFFCFSGFYITKSILKSSEKFVFKRLKRLLPELVFVILLTTFLIGPIFTNIPLKEYFCNKQTYIYLLNAIMIPIHNLPGVFTRNIKMQTVNGALWTLIVEFMCYIFIYVIHKLRLLKKERIIPVFIVSSILSIIALFMFRYLKLSILVSMIRPFLIFMFSCLLYFYIDKINRKHYYISIIMGIVLLLFRNYYLYNFIVIILLPIILCYLAKNIIINNKIYSYLGKISYSIYLTGFVIQQSIIDIFGGKMNSYINFTISLPITILIAIVIYEVTNKIMKEAKI